MKPPPFTYHAPRDVGAALRTLAQVRGKVLAGGQSLIPLMNMRLAAPEHLVDINRIGSLSAVDASPAGVRVGALVRHSDAEHAGAHPLLTRALRLVAHPVIRNRGTVVGSLVHADPAAELPAVLAVLDGTVRVARWDGRAVERDVPAREFFTGPLESAVQPGELAVSAYFPALGPRTGTAFEEVARRHGDYALAGVCAVVTLDDDARVTAARVACVGVGPVPVVVDVTAACEGADGAETDSAGTGGERADQGWADAARAVQEETEPESDVHASAAYRRHLVGVLAERALRNAAREGTAARGA
ncbi:xanthine dehydrogenase family protein subunit M [Nonomuraea sp. KC401]|uniref:FAD binding domain-containing protein n=1 Tax=unclassified Nonomuraea TaxID=2593643 RepID=UPI0010FF5F7E|nr:FAD binding domain-containing protein [Nonomuraea sp. KC401]NBE97899.1 xanthine dehydrogenase family protein subunit M [Nonomuraea sp. K271]TLF61906.1 xanthine dehydrogenase family protein subunit M [Nonomuraea sp. KC401]